MQTRSRAREVHGVGDALEPQLNGVDQAPPRELPLPREQSPINGQTVHPREQVPSPVPSHALTEFTQGNNDTTDTRGLIGLIHDASTRAAAQAMAQFAAQHPINPPPPFTSPKSKIVLGSRGGGAEAGGGKQPSFST
ncbi:UNVERIFIED_CONTAM: hypothetical protein Sradi_2401300 [Sesamum radiatum]|uniref:Uncharacterized protein n=1 Tax=Sesamum radiatum TaxID=300843 RepID=A0AAW2SI42_SESRA